VIKIKYYIRKRCKKMGGSKNARKPNGKKRFYIIHQKTKVSKLGSPKNEKAEKNLVNYIKWKP
jgi:hypothetical protein